MKQFITAFIYNWSPWHLRKRVAKLKHDLDYLTCIKDMVSESHMYDTKKNERLTKENERLTEENKRLLNQINSVISIFETQADVLKRCGDVCGLHANTLKRICDKGDQQ